MAERVQVVLEAQDMASGVLRGLVSQFGTLGQVVSDASDAFGRFTEFMDMASRAQDDASISAEDLESAYADAGKAMARLGETIAVLIVQTIKEAIKVTDEYNQSIRDLSLISGQGAEETSRFIQVLDDYQLTADDATLAAKALKEKGLSPNIETLARLADEFKKINDPAERMAFVQENLGKGGAKWVNVLNQESDALRKAAASIDPMLVKTDEQIKKSEIARLAVDKLADSWAAFQNRIGEAKNEMLFQSEAGTRALEILKAQGVEINGATTRTKEYKDALAQAKEELLADADASLQYTESLKEQEEAAAKAAAANKALLEGAMQTTEDMKAFGEKQADTLTKLADLQAEKQELKAQGWNDESEKVQDVIAKIDELKVKYAEDAAAYAEAQKEKFAMNAISAVEMEDGLAGFTEAEYEKARVIAETTGMISESGLEQQYAMQLLTDSLTQNKVSAEEYGATLNSVMADGVVSVQEVTDALNAIPKDIGVTVTINTVGDLYALQSANSNQGAQIVGQGSQGRKHAGGGSFLIPMAYGNEGFRMGNGDTASGGESVTITPRGKSPNADVVAAIYATKIDETSLARKIIEGVLKVAK